MVEGTVTGQQHSCCTCGVVFWLPISLVSYRKSDKRSFFCPNGHGQTFTGQSELEELRKQVARLTESKEYWKRDSEGLSVTCEKLRRKLERLKKGARRAKG